MRRYSVAPSFVLFYVCLEAARSVFVLVVQLKPSFCQRSSLTGVVAASSNLCQEVDVQIPGKATHS